MRQRFGLHTLKATVPATRASRASRAVKRSGADTAQA